MIVWPFIVVASDCEEVTKCEICQTELGDEPHTVLELPPVLELPAGSIVRRKFHNPCLVAYLLAHVDDPEDEIFNYINRKLVSL
jgi:hypothetical protein